jgi:hypothetical protein
MVQIQSCTVGTIVEIVDDFGGSNCGEVPEKKTVNLLQRAEVLRGLIHLCLIMDASVRLFF